MDRYDTRITDGTLYVEWEDDWIEVGAMAEIEDRLGGETYEVEYDDRQSTVPWLEDDLEDNTLAFDVTETIREMDFTAEFVEEVAEASLEPAGDDHPERTAVFARKMREIWDQQGRDGED